MTSRIVQVTIPTEHLDKLDDRARIALSAGMDVTMFPPEVAVLVAAYRDRDREREERARERQGQAAMERQLKMDAASMLGWGVGLGLLLGRWMR